ncbi:GNAT family N-acetyltransferase [Paenibacillus cymbidii]|uniref:GNAT family N-acetyltransferase n=1 Tax=Paenibacillus cymbidii TaxID=1639034 RepID=UPI0010815D33|nr:GNAT family N-acetyltransferase [Paenibacillus cymbidii]
MLHDITVEKFGIRLRPVAIEDARYIYDIRNRKDLAKYIGEMKFDFSIHLAWLNKYFDRPGDYYFCIELLSGKRIGVISIYDIINGIGEWGRWVIEPPWPAAPASAWLIYHVAFDLLKLNSVFCRSVVDNIHVISFHDNSGLERDNVESGGMVIDGKPYDLMTHVLHHAKWEETQKKLEKSAKVAERFLAEAKQFECH